MALRNPTAWLIALFFACNNIILYPTWQALSTTAGDAFEVSRAFGRPAHFDVAARVWDFELDGGCCDIHS